ncbi:MAG: CBS domain-containing protein [Candidatus Methanoperedenaceae archaeon]|nr:CBS domain-containing protein [Candidatus Methanoperedenaceae archaeon]
MNTSIQIGKIMGIPIKLHITFLLILPVFAWIFANNPEGFGFSDVESATLRYSLGMATAVLLFTCVLLHELGHSFVALKHGSKIQGITLFLFGGVSSMEEIPRNPKIELKMALAGPGVSLFIGSSLLVIHDLFNTGSSYFRIIWLIGYINIILFIFNLMPAFPMDGGRVLRAWLAGRMSYINATHAAAGVGKMFAIFMGILGVLTFPPGAWLLLIAFFIYIGASEEDKATEINIKLEGLKIRDIMTKDVATVNPGMSVEELVNLMFKSKHMGYPVMNGDKLSGIVTFSDVRNIPKEERINMKVSQVMTKALITLNEHEDVVQALKTMTINNIGRIIVTETDNDRMVGILSRTDILRALQLRE